MVEIQDVCSIFQLLVFDPDHRKRLQKSFIESPFLLDTLLIVFHRDFVHVSNSQILDLHMFPLDQLVVVTLI